MTSQKTVRFMHFSDVHFGVENYGKFDPASGLNSRLIDFRNALNSAIDLALAADIEFALFTGDAYKTRDPSQTHQREFAACLRRLTEAHIPVVLLTGNHDISNARGRANSVEIYQALAGHSLTVLDKPHVHSLQTAHGNAVQIAALPYLTKSNILAADGLSDSGIQMTVEAVVKRYEDAIEWLALTCARNPDIPTVFAGHFSVTSARIGALQQTYLLNEPEVSKSCLIRPEFDYVALGHIHKFQDLNAGHAPPVVYSGSIERVDFGERNEQKGFVLVDLSRGRTSYKFIETPTRPFVQLEVDASRSDDPTTAVLADLAQTDLEGAVVKLTYKLSKANEGLVDEKRILDALGGAFIKVAVRKEIVDEAPVIRGLHAADTLDPMQVFRQYVEMRPELQKNKELLFERAEKLVMQLQQNDLV
jgi:DNA repair protein SbcD/Mre11